jgi:hypothetical protein
MLFACTKQLRLLLQVEKYRYFDPETVGLDFKGKLFVWI